MSKLFQPIQTAKIIWRSGLPYSSELNDIYVSQENGLEQARYVYIDGNRLIQRWQRLPHTASNQFVIAETGFGSGLNFLLTWYLLKQYAPLDTQLHFFSCEQCPLSRDDLSKCIALWPCLHEEAEELLANYPVLTPGFHLLQLDNGRVNLILMLGDALTAYQELLICGDDYLEKNLRTAFVDAWFLDGCSPAKNPSLWSQSLFMVMGMLSNQHTTVATFSTEAMVREGLQAAGFKVFNIKGSGSKRDRVIATYG